MTKKNILLFLPVYFSTVNKSLSAEMQFDCIFNEISGTTKYIYEYRQQYCSADYDTFMVYIVKTSSSKEPIFVIAQYTANGLNYINQVPMFSLNATSELLLDNTLF
jgi:hypothetical protein